jgi:hypothetical protein
MDSSQKQRFIELIAQSGWCEVSHLVQKILSLQCNMEWLSFSMNGLLTTDAHVELGSFLTPDCLKGSLN